MTPTIAGRYITANTAATSPATNLTDHGPSNGPWSDMLAADNVPGSPRYNPLGAQVTVHSSQTSDFTPQTITVSGQNAIRYAVGGNPFQSEAISDCSVGFSVSDVTSFTFSGADSGVGGVPGMNFEDEVLLQPLGIVLWGGVYQQSGTLQPGAYSLVVREEAFVVPGPSDLGTSSFSFTFGVPAPGSASALLLGSMAAGIGRRRRRGF